MRELRRFTIEKDGETLGEGVELSDGRVFVDLDRAHSPTWGDVELALRWGCPKGAEFVFADPAGEGSLSTHTKCMLCRHETGHMREFPHLCDECAERLPVPVGFDHAGFKLGFAAALWEAWEAFQKKRGVRLSNA
jgi:hypothetical protein